MPRSARSSSTSRYDSPYRKYQRTATTITSDGNRNPAKLDRGAGGREWRRRINTAWPSLPSVYATALVEELLAERGVEVDHVSIFRWVQRFTPLLAEAARPCRHRVGDRWWVDETYVKVSGRWRYVYRAIDQFGQVIDVYVSPRRDAGAARCFFTGALATTKVIPVEVTTDKAAVYPHVLDELAPSAWHCTQAHANNRVEADHGQLKRRLRPMRSLKTDQSARIIIAGHAFIQNIRRGHYELGVDEPMTLRVVAAFDELVLAI